MISNPTRGDATIILDGVDVLMRPSYAAISAIEQQSGKGLIALAQEAGEGSMTMATAAIVVTQLIRAGASEGDISYKHAQVATVGNLIMEAKGGLIIALKKIELVLFMAASGGYDSSGEVKATAAKAN